jgi:uncharacterized repeat protein (TIGR02543 family)
MTPTTSTPAIRQLTDGWCRMLMHAVLACGLLMLGGGVQAQTGTQTLTLVVSGSGSIGSPGSAAVCSNQCSGTLPQGTVVSLMATPAAGYTFTGWSGACSGSGTCSVTLDANKQVTATFKPVVITTKALTVTVTGTGSVGFSDGTSCSATCTKSFNTGSSVTLSAAPAAGFTFAGWGGVCSGTGTCAVTLDAAKSVSATFNAVVVTPPGTLVCGATVRCVGTGKAYATIQSAVNAAQPGDTVLVDDGNYAGFVVSRSGTASRRIVIRTAGKAAVINAPNGTVATEGGNSGGEGITLNNASHVSIEGFTVVGMGGYGLASHGATATSPMRGLVVRNNQVRDSGSTNIYLSQVADSLIEGNSASGSKTSHGIYLANGGSDNTILRGNRTFNNAKNGIHLNGDLSVGGDGLHTNVTFENNVVYANTANGLDIDGLQNALIQNNLVYGNGRHALRVFKIDAAAGPKNLRVINNTFVSGAGWAIKLSEDGGGHVLFNNILFGSSGSLSVGNLTGLKSDDNLASDRFSSDNDTTSISLASWRSLTAQDGSSQNSTAAAVFKNAAGSDYTLAATSAARDKGVSTFATLAAPTKDLLDAARPNGAANDIGAYETPAASTTPVNLSVTTTAGGSIRSSPAGIQCGSTCSASYSSGTVVSLSATPATGYAFAGWDGACSGTGACNITMDAAKGVAARFTAVVPTTQALSVAISGTGGVGFSDGSSCAASCSKSFNTGSSVTLAAAPATGYTFAGWSGACTGTSSCTVTMDAAKSVTATFSAVVVTTQALTVTVTGTGSVGFSDGTSCSATCTKSFNTGSSVTLSASPAVGYTFAGWGGVCSGTGACAVTLDAAKSASATFNAVVVTPPGTGAFYLSPTGSNGADCKSQATPCKTFAYVFSKMAAGDELVLLDGVYSSAAGTGSMHWNDGVNSAQIPSGTAARSTYVHALNPGKVTVQGLVTVSASGGALSEVRIEPGLFIGRSSRKDSYIKVQGLTFDSGAEAYTDNTRFNVVVNGRAGALYNTSFVTIKETGFHGGFGVGTNDHDQGNTDNLLEDIWVWGPQQRVIAINYRAHRNVWRRMVVRGDGCNTSECTSGGSPNVGFTVYDSHDVSVQNVIVVDRILTGAPESNYYADFAIASHTGGLYTFGRNEWLGTISLNAPDQGYYMEPDQGTIETPTVKVSNAVAWNATQGGYNLARDAQQSVLENITLNVKAGDAFRVAPDMPNAATVATVKNLLLSGTGRYAVNSSIQAAYVSQTGSWSQGLFNQTTPVNVVAAPANAMKYITRIETGSALKGAGAGGADIGANVVYRYGADGKRFGEAGHNTLGATALWPWPNEDRIKREMCVSTTRGFCSTGKRLDGVNPVSLTSYIWEQLGNPVPASFVTP